MIFLKVIRRSDTMREVKITGTGQYVPKNIVTNDDLSKIVDTNDEWITSRTGIKERRISQGENTSDLAFRAGELALKKANVNAEEIDLIIVATLTADMLTPSVACMVQSKLNATKAAAFDLNAACSGFIYALSIGTQFIKTSVYNKVLVIGAEVLSKIVNWEDRSTCVLFGDGAGAVVLEASSCPGIISVDLGADGKKRDALQCDALPVVNPYLEKRASLIEEVKKEKYVVMDGKEVFRFATGIMADSVEKLLRQANLNKEQIKYIVPHQANFRIIDYASKKLDIDINKFYINLDRYGNTSGASIPIALNEMNEKELLKKGDYIVLVGFGGGLTFGAALIQW